jgi:protein-S-isoprenylcysteine O-methyltransferase Ste14
LSAKGAPEGATTPRARWQGPPLQRPPTSAKSQAPALRTRAAIVTYQASTRPRVSWSRVWPLSVCGASEERDRALDHRVGLRFVLRMRERHVIDFFKLATGPFVLACMTWYHGWDRMAPWLYLGLHGTYGVLWVLKSRVFPDRQWERKLTVWRALFLASGLSLYWVAPWLVLARPATLSGPLLFGCVAAFGLGVFLHFASDMQKHVALKLNPGHLIEDGLWKRVRNPNYLGELLIYGSFAALAQHWIPFAVLAMVVAIEWIPNMVRKDRSLSRYPGFREYRKRTAIIVPWLI